MDAHLLSDLKEPFDPKVIHWRVGSTNKDKTQGMALAYLNARDVMKRLDDVCGVHWQCRYPFAGCCEIGIKIDGEWVWRANGAGETDVEGEKGQYSDAFKRAAAAWGVGRYLYYLKPFWTSIQPQGRSYILGTVPELPKWAIPTAKPSETELEAAAIDLISLIKADKGADAHALWEHLPAVMRKYLSVPIEQGGLLTESQLKVVRGQ